jgi:hypothetical protein
MSNETTKIMRRPKFAIVFASVPGRGDIKKQIQADNAKRGEAIGRLLRWQHGRHAIRNEIDLGYWKGRSAILKGMKWA